MTPISVHTHGDLMYPTPMSALIVVNGNPAISTGLSVAAPKNVLLPTFALPTNPTIFAKRAPLD
jgi:hypothetical protein